MGKLYDRLCELSTVHKEILDYVAKLRNLYNEDKILRQIEECFKVLRPISKKYTVVCKYKGVYHGDYDVCIGKWFRLKHSYQTYGSPVDEPYLLYEIIASCGEKIVEHVRPKIRDKFAKLTELTKRIELPSKVKIETTVNGFFYEYSSDVYYCSMGEYVGEVIYQAKPINSIKIYWECPEKLFYYVNGEEDYEDVERVTFLFRFEDLLNDVVNLYKQLLVLAEGIYRYNEKILREMRKTVIVELMEHYL